MMNSAIMSQGKTDSQVHLYWATGCTSCLRAKEFLERNEVPFVSHNVVEDEAILDEMAERGMPRRVPIVRRGDEWGNAQTLEEVARIADVEHEAEPLPVEELYRRLEVVLEAVQRYLRRVPEHELRTDIPNRPRSYGELVYHIFSIPESFLEHEEGARIKRYKPEPEWTNRSKAALETYGQHVQVRLRDWRESPDWERDWSETPNDYHGDRTVHEFFERTTWHAGQHTRQLEWILGERLDADYDSLDPEVWEGLPLPEQVWDAT
jgi:glutaredoxin